MNLQEELAKRLAHYEGRKITPEFKEEITNELVDFLKEHHLLPKPEVNVTFEKDGSVTYSIGNLRQGSL